LRITRLPRVSATFTIDAGPITEGSKAGRYKPDGSMLNEGPRPCPKAAFDDAVIK